MNKNKNLMTDAINKLELPKILALLENECVSDGAKEKAAALSPLSDIHEIENELELTDTAFQLSVKYGSPTFYRFTNISSAVKLAGTGATIGLRDILSVAKLLTQTEKLSRYQAEDSALSYIFSQLRTNSYLLKKIENTVVSENEISDNASAELSSIRKKLIRARAKLKETLDKIIKTEKDVLQDSVITLRNGRYVIPVKAEHKNRVGGLLHDTSSSGQTYFIEPMGVVDANNDIRLLETQEQDEIARIISEICSDIGSFGEELIEDYKICTKLDLRFAMSNLGAKMKASVPSVTDKGIINLKKARHPLIPKERVVPVSIALGEGYNALIISGPNTGGKTACLKTVGLLTLMTMCGLLIPVADGSVVNIPEKILVDIGDMQSIEYDLSTFSAHLKNIVEILQEADPGSLVLIDEIGSGTDPVEGAALAVAILENLISKGSKIAATTHYQELKLYALENENIENASFEFDIENIKPTYNLIIGSPGKSNAFKISESLGISHSIIEKAQSLIGENEQKFENAIVRLNEESEKLKKQNAEIEIRLIEINDKNDKLKKELERTKSQKQAELEKARTEANTIIERTKFTTNALITELEEIRKEKNKEKIGEAKQTANRVYKELYEKVNPVDSGNTENYVLPREIKIGDYVELMDIGQEGTVITDVSGGKVFVQVGSLKTKTAVTNLKLLEKKKPQKPNFSTTRNVKNVTKLRDAGSSVDIRGMTVSEGINALELFIGDSVLSNRGNVMIIHGVGTGILKNAIRKRLKELKPVKMFRPGVYGEGEDGVTIVELR
ncbi:MAG: endonuclease MutS2 [Ruminococcus sp.]|nr:endonuclease MutS2 [Ruminococcus sp.]